MSELRQDLVSGDWIIVAAERGKRPHFLGKRKAGRKPSPKSECPFEDLRKSGNWPPLYAYPGENSWEIAVIPNKYPALTHLKGCAAEFHKGPYRVKSGAGEHELLVTRDHKKTLADLSLAEAMRVFKAFRERNRAFARNGCSRYASIFFNWGASAGASIYHPHYQLLSLPIIPPHVKNSLFGAERYFRAHKKCVRCVMIASDKKDGKRVVAENKLAIAVAPFASKMPFEISIFPKRHRPYFEDTPDRDLEDVVRLLRTALRRVRERLYDPDLNFFIHTAPFDHRKYGFHHWHIEVLPKVSLLGGFELSTGVDINVVDPEYAAKTLR